MKTIYKYEIGLGSKIDILLPSDAKVLLVEVQGMAPCVWVEHDLEKPKITRTFSIIGTGHEIPEEAAHVGSFQMPPFVWHLYEKLP